MIDLYYIGNISNITISIEAQLGISHSLGYLLEHLVSELAESISHIRDLLLHNLFQKRSEFGQGCVVLVVEPTLNEYAVVGLKLEVLSDIIHYYGFCEISPDTTEILHKDRPIGHGVLAVEPMLYSFGGIYLVQHPISVL